jgi:hypothetical protein
MRRTLAALLCLLGSWAWADVPATTSPDAEKVPQSIWRVAPDGNATHLQSTLVCPSEVGDFRQTRLTVYDHAGFDVSCNYRGRHGWITLYLTRLGGMSLDAAFDDAKHQLVQATPDAVPLSDAEQKNFAGAEDYRHLIYSEKNGALWSGLWMTEFSGWMFEFRASYAPQAQQEMFDEMAELAHRAASTAAKHLAICAKATPVVRDGTLVTDKEAISKAMMMVSLFGAVESAAERKADDKTANEGPVSWCAESIVGPQPGVFWRAVYDDGSDATADRVTPVSVEDPPVLSSAPDLLAAALGDEKDKGGPQWFISLKTGKKTWYFAIYQGRPPVDVLARMLSDIAEHKARTIGGFSVDGKNITIDMPPGK